MKKLLLTTTTLLCTAMGFAQSIDFNYDNAQDQFRCEPNFIPWNFPHQASDTKTLDNGITIKVEATGLSTTLRTQWHKNTIQTWGKDYVGYRMMGDGVVAFIATNDDDAGNEDPNGSETPNQTTKPMSMAVTLSGLSVGKHTLAAYHIWKDPVKDGYIMPTIKVEVERKDIIETTETITEGDETRDVTTRTEVITNLPGQTGVEYANVQKDKGVLKMADARYSYVEFDILQEGQPITFTYTTEVESGKTYQTTCMMLNGLLIDRSPVQATDPYPNSGDYHVDADNGSCTLEWAGSTVAVKHHLVWGTDEAEVEAATTYQYSGTNTSYKVNGLSSMKRYYWRIDEEDAGGKIYKGNVWSFQPRHLAFPGAEGYGKYAIGGRGGKVYHVTSLSGGNEPGTLLYGLCELNEPRYIVFDVSGTIELDFESHFTKPYATIAGQTAPGKGICIKASNINIGSDVICRHMRFKRGLGVYGENTGNAMGMTGADHSIVDHCTATWGTDETVSGRGALNISFQYCGIFEALGIAGHKNYQDGTNHGYAATIDGRIGSWHHNLLANCEGRNWSMGGGMDSQNIPIGGLDLFNNVVYNWHNRTTDGNCHNVNFVNNYYKMGKNTRKKILFTQDFESGINVEGGGQDIAYISGNIRENNDTGHTKQQDALDKTYNATGNIPTTYEYRVSSPLFESLADEIHSAEDAMRIVTSYAGATMPQRDEQHLRIVKETLSGTHTYTGSKSGIKGEIDDEADITEHLGGWEDYPEEHRADDWDTDQDGMPNWWEECTGSNPSQANANDATKDNYTKLEDYLNFMAHPYVIVEPGKTATIDLKAQFAGFYGQNSEYGNNTPSFTKSTPSLATAAISGNTLSITGKATPGIDYINITASEGGTTFTQRFGIAVTGQATGIATIKNEAPSTEGCDYYNLSGQRIEKPGKGIYIINGKKVVKK